MADAGHNLSDVLGLLMAWGAAGLARRRPSHRFTYGLRSTSILAALANAALLLVACGAIGWEAVLRLGAPPAVAGMTVSMVAAVGILVNGVSAWLFMRGSKTDLNIRGAYLHMAADAVVSLGVVIAGVLMIWTGWYWLDAVVSLVIVAVIVAGTWGLLSESVRLALSGVPRHIDSTSVQAFLQQVPGVQGIHDVHIWGISTTETAMTAHLVMPDGQPEDVVLQGLMQTLRERFKIDHSTLQFERGTLICECSLTPATDTAKAQPAVHVHRHE
jgi:cobalt-zinc-cadmium efflux system protein